MTDAYSLNALAAHAAGDFPLQTDEMAREKFDDPTVRAKHVAVYTSAFIPVTMAADWDRRQAVVFLSLLGLSHFVIDTRRWKEPVDGFEAFPVWFDQALHVIALAVVTAITSLFGGKKWLRYKFVAKDLLPCHAFVAM